MDLSILLISGVSRKKEPEITFVVKALGDWTRQLKDWLKDGMQVQVEGPYGRFDFSDPAPQQIWVGAGIGVTPFIARMKHLAQQGGEHNVDFFHITTEVDQAAIDKLSADAAAAGIRLHIRVSPRDGRLTPELIRSAVPNWQQASIWFCGPTPFGQILFSRVYLRSGCTRSCSKCAEACGDNQTAVPGRLNGMARCSLSVGIAQAY